MSLTNFDVCNTPEFYRHARHSPTERFISATEQIS
jgi:hypothetical protein